MSSKKNSTSPRKLSPDQKRPISHDLSEMLTPAEFEQLMKDDEEAIKEMARLFQEEN